MRIQGEDRLQSIMFPEVLDDYVRGRAGTLHRWFYRSSRLGCPGLSEGNQQRNRPATLPYDSLPFRKKEVANFSKSTVTVPFLVLSEFWSFYTVWRLVGRLVISSLLVLGLCALRCEQAFWARFLRNHEMQRRSLPNRLWKVCDVSRFAA